MIGSISHGTLRPGDLVHSFYNVLDTRLIECEEENRKNPTSWNSKDIHAGWKLLGQIDGYEELMGTEEFEESERCCVVLDDLFLILDQLSPPNLYFGAHLGDASDFGWWEVEAP